MVELVVSATVELVVSATVELVVSATVVVVVVVVLSTAHRSGRATVAEPDPVAPFDQLALTFSVAEAAV